MTLRAGSPHACRCLVPLFSFLVGADAYADVAVSPQLDLVGDVRSGYYWAQRDAHNGTGETTDQIIARFRGGLQWKASEHLTARIRLAGRYATRNNDLHFELFESIPDTDGLRSGDSAVAGTTHGQ